jgi:hypothetical protein
MALPLRQLLAILLFVKMGSRGKCCPSLSQSSSQLDGIERAEIREDGPVIEQNGDGE